MKLPARFWWKVNRHGPVPAKRPDLGPCWLWKGSRNPKGYGTFFFMGKPRLAHRLAYEATKGPLPDGHEPDHLCVNPPCVNPTHLEAVTHAENLRRADLHDVGAAQRAATHCGRGHAFTPENTRVYRGWRQCRECQTITRRARRADRPQPGGTA